MQISDSLTARTVSIGGNCGTCRTDLLSTELQEPKSLWVRPYAPMPSTCSTTRSSTPGSAYSSPLPTRTTAISTTRLIVTSRDSGWHRCFEAQVHTEAKGVPSGTRWQASFFNFFPAQDLKSLGLESNVSKINRKQSK